MVLPNQLIFRYSLRPGLLPGLRCDLSPEGRAPQPRQLAIRQHGLMPARSQNSGFTLMEILVALTIFAVIGVLSAQLINRTLSNQDRITERGERLAEVQRAMMLLKRDIMQITARPVRDLLGDAKASVLIGNDGLMEFSRLGWRNPLRQQRAEVQRVTYMVQDGDLYRAWWPVLDRAPDTEPVLQRLLPEVGQIEFFALDSFGDEHSYWPLLPVEEEGVEEPRLVAIILRLDSKPFGVVERIWPVPTS